jgi:hypothetical protein
MREVPVPLLQGSPSRNTSLLVTDPDTRAAAGPMPAPGAALCRYGGRRLRHTPEGKPAVLGPVPTRFPTARSASAHAQG